jgi:hypothetical protein
MISIDFIQKDENHIRKMKLVNKGKDNGWNSNDFVGTSQTFARTIYRIKKIVLGR